MFRFRFHALLAVRRREELIRQGALARALLEERAAGAARAMLMDERDRRRAELRDTMRLATRGIRDPVPLALVTHLATIEERIARAVERCDRTLRVRLAAAARLEEAARPRRAVEHLQAAEYERYEAARRRTEERDLDEANRRRIRG